VVSGTVVVGVEGREYAPRTTSSRALRLEVRMNDGAVLGQRRGLDQFVVPLHIERLVVLSTSVSMKEYRLRA